MAHNDTSPQFSEPISILLTWPPENRRSLPGYVWPILGGRNVHAGPFGKERGTAHEACHDEGWRTWCVSKTAGTYICYNCSQTIMSTMRSNTQKQERAHSNKHCISNMVHFTTVLVVGPRNKNQFQFWKLAPLCFHESIWLKCGWIKKKHVAC